MRPLVIGTAGHIDHGKTSLVQALTGVNTDRLKEERERGITIELGFTHLTLPSGAEAGFVDVPGHERFVRTMIAGATGIDVVLLVVAADEGVMPQTREHLDILRLLGVEVGLVVLTKVDLVDAELLELVQLDVAELVTGTFLEDAPVLPFSSVTGQGKDALLLALEAAASRTRARSGDGPARLPVDRIFTRKGFGTIVTGTLASGSIAAGDVLELLPDGQKVKVRGVQVHGREAPRAYAGMRTALNLQGIEKETLDRGDVLVTPDTLTVTSIADVHLLSLASAAAPLGEGRGEARDEARPLRVRVLTATLEVMAVLHLLSEAPLAPGEADYAQLHFERPIPLAAGDRLVVRAESPVTTLAGGEVVHPSPRRHRRRDRDQARTDCLALHRGGPQEATRTWLQLAGEAGLTVDRLWRLSRRDRGQLAAALEEGVSAGWALTHQGVYVSARVVAPLREATLARLQAFHQAHPLAPGATPGELRGNPPLPEAAWLLVLRGLLEEGTIASEGPVWRQRGWQVLLTPAEQDFARRLGEDLEVGGLSPPLLPELLVRARAAGIPRDEAALLDHLLARGLAQKIKEDLWISPAAATRLQETVTDFLRLRGEMTPTDFKDLTGLSRKYAIPLLEHLDKIKLTLRTGDVRRLRTL